MYEIIKEMAKRRECSIEEGHLLKDHVHILISIPPKISVASAIGYIKGKTAIEIARKYGKRKNFTGESFWARGYLASTVGNNESVIREYIKNQESEDRKLEQLKLFK
jgi:putative transposase